MTNPYQAPSDARVISSSTAAQLDRYTVGDQLYFEMSVDDLLALHDYYYRKSPTVRRNHMSSLVVQIAFVELISIWLWLDPPLDIDPALGFLIAFVIAPVAFLYALVTYRRRLRNLSRKLLSEGKNRSFIGQHRVGLFPEGIQADTELTKTLYRWPSIEKVAETADYLFLFVGGHSALIFPRRAFTSDDHWRSFIAETMQHVGDAEYVDDRQMRLTK